MAWLGTATALLVGSLLSGGTALEQPLNTTIGLDFSLALESTDQFAELGNGTSYVKMKPPNVAGPARISCNAMYNAPCSRINSEWLTMDTAYRLDRKYADGIPSSEFLADVTNKVYNLDQGFYPFVFQKNSSLCVAHGENPALVGLTLSAIFEKLNIGFSSSDDLLKRFVHAADSGGGWVQYFWEQGDKIGNKEAYVAPTANGEYFVGVGFDHVQLPPDLPCSDKFDSWCSINNVRSLLGKAQDRLNGVSTLEQFETALFDISFDESTFQIPGGYYLFAYKFRGELVAHAHLQAFFGLKIPQIFEQLNRDSQVGANLHQAMIAAANGHHDGWIQYNWRNRANEPEYVKIAYVMKLSFQGENYYIGCGYNHIMGEVIPAPLGGRCPNYNLPCAFGTTLQLSSHALSHAVSSSLSVQRVFEAISYDPSLKHGDYYVFMFDFNSTCVAHGLMPELVGLTLSEITESLSIGIDHSLVMQQLESTAKRGGGFVSYEWIVPGIPHSNSKQVTYAFQVTLEGRNYVGGVGFNHRRAPLQLNLEHGHAKNGNPILCSREYGTNCSEVNTQAILGQALSDLHLAAAEAEHGTSSANATVDDIFSAITQGDNLYRVNDFFVSVFSFDGRHCTATASLSSKDNSGCCVAHGGNASFVGMTWQQILDLDEVASIRGEDLHSALSQPTDQGGGWYEYTRTSKDGIGHSMRALSSRVRHNGEYFYVTAEYVSEIPPPSCDRCPENMECVSQEQSFCQPKRDILPFHRSLLFVVLLGFFLGLPPVGALFCWVGKRREKLQAEAQIREIDEQMKMLREQMDREKMTVAQTRKLVSTLFPETVQGQVLEQLAQEENRSAKDKLGRFLFGGDAGQRLANMYDRPIAELFPSVTVVFMDIVGLTGETKTKHKPAN